MDCFAVLRNTVLCDTVLRTAVLFDVELSDVVDE